MSDVPEETRAVWRLMADDRRRAAAVLREYARRRDAARPPPPAPRTPAEMLRDDPGMTEATLDALDEEGVEP